MSPDHTDTVPLIEKLLKGDPEIEIVVDRRVSERRTDPEGEDGGAPETERREGERRRRASFYLV